MVKIFCPKCQDVYSCSPTLRQVDGAYFGTTFPNLFFMTYEDLAPETGIERHIPRVFGFKVHSSSRSLPKLVGRSEVAGGIRINSSNHANFHDNSEYVLGEEGKIVELRPLTSSEVRSFNHQQHHHHQQQQQQQQHLILAQQQQLISLYRQQQNAHANSQNSYHSLAPSPKLEGAIHDQYVRNLSTETQFLHV